MAQVPQVVVDNIFGVREKFNQVLVDKQISFDREAEFALQILSNNEYAIGICKSNPQSLIDSVTNVAAIGVSLNPARKQAYLVPRDGRICLDISYMGLIDIAIDAGSISWAQAKLVYSNDRFVMRGLNEAPIHEHNPFKDRGEVVGAYVVVRSGNDFLTETMSLEEIEAVRNRSSAWKAWVSKKKSCPWVTDFGEMAKKTVVKRGSKYWPRGLHNDRLSKAIEYVNTDGGEGLHDIQDKPAAAPEPEVINTYPQDRFDANLPTWTTVITSGRKTAQQIIDFAGAVAPLTDAQRMTLLKLNPATNA